MSSKTGFLYDEHCFWHTAGEHALILPIGDWVQPMAAGGHAESPETKRRFKNLLEASGLSSHLAMSSAPPASEAQLLKVHPEHYLNEFKLLSDQKGGELGLYAPFGKGSYEIASQSAGLACSAVDRVMRGEWKNAYSLSRPPGHHCLADKAMGFCLLANIAVAAEHAIAEYGVNRIAVIDWDVHHGNGTQDIFYSRSDVLTISIHQQGCFPPGYNGVEDTGSGNGQGKNINIPLMPGGGHQSYLDAMENIVIPALHAYQPELIFVASGYDASGVDPLVRMLAHSDTYRQMTKITMEVANQHCENRLIVVHEGGYSEAYVPFCGLAVMEALTDIRTGVEDPLLDLICAQQPDQDFVQLQREKVLAMSERFDLLKPS